MIARAALALLVALAPGPRAAAATADAAVASALIEKAAALLREAPEGEARLAALGKAVTAYESGLAAIRRGLRRLNAREAELAREAEAHRAETERLLGLLMSMRLTEPPALLTHPGGPVAHERAGHLMAGLAPSLRARTEALKATVAEARAIRDRQAEARAQAREALAALQRARVAAAEALRDTDAAGAPRAAALAGAARSLEAFAAALADLPAVAPSAESPDYGDLPLPVVGEVVARYGDREDGAPPLPGVRIAAPAYAQISAPFAATLRYAGPLNGYGNVAILEPEAGRLLVLAGLARVDRAAGETVGAGEPLGALGDAPAVSAEFFVEASAGNGAISEETLYMEVREDGVPVDPASWFAMAD